MTAPLFLLETLADPRPAVGAVLELGGDEGRHAAVVRRIGAGEQVLVADGRGRGVRAEVTAASKAGLTLRVVEHLDAPDRALRVVAVQALAKGDRSELAVEMLTEVGVSEIWPWQASRSIVRWSAERGEKSLGRWRSTAREATKQSRRLLQPALRPVLSTAGLCRELAGVDLALVLHEDATTALRDVDLPERGTVALVVGPEGGITPEELEQFAAAGARAVSVSDAVLRTSTAGVVAVAGLLLR
ncbi:16S rRNA (uracil1498-N3)-methyltransferase [Friedmanniella luteola]|uniref:Ribosomal RNA small subunit methyltransferase E n=1 Tax=Friedmanniella luteola TaxID=546871 RepID=A0A1H1X4V4_9ACTN|nr:16S rRNA (uracil(1498)-N(3))-methyltransferase [Friedmanniella luteola]SDT04367.1 16S rRNA (uracil1498-N3)-methyltransferase [Friedmanniella luteola]